MKIEGFKEQELMLALLKKAETDKSIMKNLKNVAVKCQDFELAARLREMENFFFPETEEIKKSKDEANNIKNALHMVGIQVDLKDVWLVLNTIRVYDTKGGSFSIDDATKLAIKREELFN